MIEAPTENFSRGLVGVDIPELGPKIEGKVRDIWVVGRRRIMVTTDRTSAYDHLICTIPDKGSVLNSLSEYWFNRTKDIVSNHSRALPHPNVLIATQAEVRLPVEVVLRNYMAKSSTSTSVYYNYTDLGRRNIYGLDFPDGLVANQKFPMGTILTPTTKADEGHDLELTDEEARDIVDKELGSGMWEKTKKVSGRLFASAYEHYSDCGLILADTKYEFGIDKDGRLMLIDEIHTSDSSRFWLLSTYRERVESGQDPESFDKEILRKYLAEQGFTGKKDQQIPAVSSSTQDQLTNAYKTLFSMVTGQKLPTDPSNPDQIRAAVLKYLDKNPQ